MPGSRRPGPLRKGPRKAMHRRPWCRLLPMRPPRAPGTPSRGSLVRAAPVTWGSAPEDIGTPVRNPVPCSWAPPPRWRGVRMAKTALVLVAHSALLARGCAEVAAQMAPDVVIVPAGGTAEAGIGTDYEAVERSITEALADGAA